MPKMILRGLRLTCERVSVDSIAASGFLARTHAHTALAVCGLRTGLAILTLLIAAPSAILVALVAILHSVYAGRRLANIVGTNPALAVAPIDAGLPIFAWTITSRGAGARWLATSCAAGASTASAMAIF